MKSQSGVVSIVGFKADRRLWTWEVSGAMEPAFNRKSWVYFLALGLGFAFGNITVRELRTGGYSRGSSYLLGGLVAAAVTLLIFGVATLVVRGHKPQDGPP